MKQGINHRKLREIVERVRTAKTVGVTVRQLLRLFYAKKLGLGTEPSFKMPTRYEAVVRFVVRQTKAEIACTPP